MSCVVNHDPAAVAHQPARLLGANGCHPCCGASEKRNKIPAPHLITSPAKDGTGTRLKRDLITLRTGRPCESSQNDVDHF
jgi:hypothetical protein